MKSCSRCSAPRSAATTSPLRNLLLDANAKIGELDAIKAAVGKLADPVSKTLRAYEAEKSEKLSLQAVLNNTRTAYGKLRNEVAEFEKKATHFEHECGALRQELTTTQSLLRAVEAKGRDLHRYRRPPRPDRRSGRPADAGNRREPSAARGKPPSRRAPHRFEQAHHHP